MAAPFISFLNIISLFSSKSTRAIVLRPFLIVLPSCPSCKLLVATSFMSFTYSRNSENFRFSNWSRISSELYLTISAMRSLSLFASACMPAMLLRPSISTGVVSLLSRSNISISLSTFSTGWPSMYLAILSAIAIGALRSPL